jgi:hypothetical protein
MGNGKVYIFENQEVASSFFSVNRSTFIDWVSQKTKGYLTKGIKSVTMLEYTTGKYEKKLLVKRRTN